MVLNALVEKLKRRSKDDFKGRHYEATLILQAISWYLRYPLSYRDIEELFLERGLEVDHATLNRWVLAYAPLIERRLRAFRKPHCGSVRVDETSYEDRCVKSVLLSAGRHRPVPPRRKLLLGTVLPQTRHLGGDDPAAVADLDCEDQRAVVVQSIAGGDMRMLGHGSAPGNGGA